MSPNKSCLFWGQKYIGSRRLWGMRWRWGLVHAGVLAPLVALGCIALAILSSPSFSWSMDPLSRLGVTPAPTSWLFNGGLVASAVIAVPFGVPLWMLCRNWVERVGVVVFGFSVLMLFLIGLFPMDTALHGPVSVGFFSLFTVAFLVYGSGNYLAGDVVRGLGTVLAGVVHALVWLVWALLIAGGGGEGLVALPESMGSLMGAEWIAVPETIGALMISGWGVFTARSTRLQSFYNQE